MVPDGALTPRLFSELRAGDRLHLGRPKGLFTLRPNDRRTHLFVATGTGLAPFVAMTETLLGEARPPRIVVVHGVAYAEELAFRDRFERWAGDHGVGYVPAISSVRTPRPTPAGVIGPAGSTRSWMRSGPRTP